MSPVPSVRIDRVITVLSGENSFELARSLEAIIAAFPGTAEKFDGDSLELSQLPDLLQGGTLFATERLIIVRELSENKRLWDVLPDWLERIDADVQLVLVEPKPDKRTKTYKELKKHAEVREFAPWGDRDVMTAEKWVSEEASRQGVEIDRRSVQTLVARVGLDQWQLYHALEKLAALGTVTPQIIEQVIDATPNENVFNLLDAALRGDVTKVHAMIASLERTQDPYMTFGLLSGQVFQLAALAVSDKTSAEVAKDIGAHPYALGKLAPHAKKLGRSGSKKLLEAFADTDTAMKSTTTEPWLLIEKTLIHSSI